MKRLCPLAVLALSLGICACSSMIPSLAPGLHDNAVAYDAAISDINNKVLLANIVRARDFVPLSITELSTITGTLSETATLGLSVPFGGNYGSVPRGTATPSIQLGAAPTFNMAALNTRGFTLNIIQPISPVYVASKWNSGIAHELLLLLFVKDIQFADSYALTPEDCTKNSAPAGSIEPSNAAKSASKPLVVCHHKFINNPDRPGEQKAFKAVIENMLPSVGLKVMTILEPIGPAFPFLPQGTTAGGTADKSTSNLLDAYVLTSHLGDGQYHIGDNDKMPGHGQLYRVYANQVAICANDPVKTEDGTFYIYPVSADITAASHAALATGNSPGTPLAPDREDRLQTFKNQCVIGNPQGDHACNSAKALNGRPMSSPGVNAFSSYALLRAATRGANAEVEERAADGAARSGSPGGSASTVSSVSTTLQHNRIGALLRADDCYADQTVREPTTESEFQKYTETLGHIEWRSIAEIFQYLGAVLRQENGVTWDVALEPDVVGSKESARPDTMFVLRAAGATAKLKVEYEGEKVGIGSGHIDTARGALNDQSLLVLSMISELVNAAKISSDIPVTQQLQVLP
jgi:hypothetical protein